MSRMPRLLVLLVWSPVFLAAQSPGGVRILLGIGDATETKWDGSVSARGAKITAVEGWRFEPPDAIDGTSWKASTRAMRVRQAQPQKPPLVANGVLVFLDSAAADVEIEAKTAQGEFSFRLGDLPFGAARKLLANRVQVERIPAVSRLTNDAEEQDYPALARAKDGTVWMSYVEMHHHQRHNEIRANYEEAPASLDELDSPPGGARILVKRCKEGKWSDPIFVEGPALDLYHSAIAVDGKDRAWVFYSEQRRTGMDLWARLMLADGTADRSLRLTNDRTPDHSPVAATDSTGRVWVAWQGFRNEKHVILAAVQNGDRFSEPTVVASSAGNEWNPAIAASNDGRITIAWDSYRNGNYDVYFRTAGADGVWGKETPAAATARYEAYPSIAYDAGGRLWIAYEEGGERWGKDFGAYETTGIAIYRSRAIRLIGFEKSGQAFRPATDIGTVLPGAAVARAEVSNRQIDSEGALNPQSNLAGNRRPSATPPASEGAKNSLPRLHIDDSGRIWLAFRTPNPVWWNPLGSVWTEYVVTYDGNRWQGPIYLHHTDNILDNRPALLSMKPGELWIAGSADGRRDWSRMTAGSPITLAGPRRRVVQDPYNNDLYVNAISLGPASDGSAVALLDTPGVAGADPRDKAEGAQIAAMRKYRLRLPTGLELQLARGEFHRHSEFSADGANDGTLRDQYRYAWDPADLDWIGCCDHDNGGGREYSWWTAQQATDLNYVPGIFVSMYSYERSVNYPEGHRNVLLPRRGIRPLPRLPISKPDPTASAPDTQLLYRYLKQFGGVTASHTSGTNMGTDWRDNDPQVEPFVEIYQGDRQNYEMPGAPRTNSEGDSIGGWRPKGFVNLALEMGYKLAFESSSDHVSTHMSYAIALVNRMSREAVMEAFKKRHVYAATDNILAEFRSGEHILGDEFTSTTAPEFKIKLVGTAPFSKVTIIKDNQYVYTTQPKKGAVEFTWRDNAAAAGKRSYYYVRGEQEDGELVWISPMWITYKPRP